MTWSRDLALPKPTGCFRPGISRCLGACCTLRHPFQSAVQDGLQPGKVKCKNGVETGVWWLGLCLQNPGAGPEALLPEPFVLLALSAVLSLCSSPPLCLEGRGFHRPSHLLLTSAILPQTPGMPTPFLPTPLNLSKFPKEETCECFLTFEAQESLPTSPVSSRALGACSRV